MDYSTLPIETRMMALGLWPLRAPLGLPICPPRRAGRPWALSMLQKIKIAIEWAGYMNAHARVEAPRDRGQVKRLQQKLEAGRMNGDAQFLLDRMSAKLDALGRVSRKIVLSPRIALPEADKAIAKRFGITERMVRKIRSDKRMQPFMGRPLWEVPDWQRKGAEAHAARATAKRLMTPERYAKSERVWLDRVGLGVEAVQEDAYGPANKLHVRHPHMKIVHHVTSGPPSPSIAFSIDKGPLRPLPVAKLRAPRDLGFRPQWALIERKQRGHARRIEPIETDPWEDAKTSQEYYAKRRR
jgi:hypothetical protein